MSLIGVYTFRLTPNRLFIPTLGPTDWRRLLAKPETQWEPGRSALEMAVSWESARDSDRRIPAEVASALDSVPELKGAELLLGIPEHQVQFPPGGHPSQNDLWALLRAGPLRISLTIEAKAGEPLDNLVKDWLKSSSPNSGKPARLEALQRHLGIPDLDVSQLRYQLLHRTASALKEAERFGANVAVMLMRSFNRTADEESWQDFRRFGAVMDAAVKEDGVAPSPRPTDIPLYLGWVNSKAADLQRLRAAI
jgi:hypothetical protein